MPASPSHPPIVFLAAPFHGYLDAEGQKMVPDKITMIQNLLAFLRAKGFVAQSAHEREAWGEDWYGPEVCTPLDIETIRVSDLVIAIPGPPLSGGVHVELGWASCLGRRIVLLLEKDHTYSNLVMGLGELTDVRYIIYDDIDEVYAPLEAALQTWFHAVPDL